MSEILRHTPNQPQVGVLRRELGVEWQYRAHTSKSIAPRIEMRHSGKQVDLWMLRWHLLASEISHNGERVGLWTLRWNLLAPVKVRSTLVSA